MQSNEPIAIVGAGGRFPGADNLEEFWRVLSKGENHVVDVPSDRWNVEAWYHPDAPGKTYCRKLGVVKGHDEFDHRLYGISETEAVKMDPQQRFVLDSVHMALEDGGFTRDQLRGSNTGVYMGVMNTDYMDVGGKNLVQTDTYTLTGSATSIVAARVSYVYDLHGPALSLDTACSSALMAVHLACQALRSGECRLAIAGGVNALLIHNTMMPLSNAKMISRVGQCQAFSENADGYVRGEGCGVVILKRLSDALEDNDKIWATVCTGTNQDGRTAHPITAPSGVQQERLLSDMYTLHNIDKSTVQYIEAHGTGTPLGDPTEVNSLGRFFGEDGSLRQIGSVKTNIGHLESAAGAAGLIKVLLMMKNKTIVPSLHSSQLNPKIPFDTYNFKVPSKCIPWQELPAGGRAAGVNSFGFGGSNCHAFVEQFIRKSVPAVRPNGEHGHKVIALSSLTPAGLKANINHLKEAAEEKQFDLEALSFTSTCRRDHLRFRLAFHVNDQKELITKLDKANLPNSDVFIPTVSHQPDKLRVVYVFCGMGTAWKGMCKDLIERETVFREELDKIDQFLKEFDSISVIKELKDQSNIHDPAIEPLLIFACQVGLAAVWRHWGVEADAVVGQSVGEVAAAHAAGILSLKSAVSVIYHRTRLLLQTVGGKMLVIGKYPVEKVEEMCIKHKGKVNIAVYSSPTSCTISGEEDAVTAIQHRLENSPNSDVFIRELGVKTAYHCHKQKPLVNSLVETLNGFKGQSGSVDIVSTVTGFLAVGEDFKSATYWARNMTEPVRFDQAIINVTEEDKVNVYIEVGPSPVLRAHVGQIFNNNNSTVVPSMERNANINVMLESLGKLYSMGVKPKWVSITQHNVAEITAEPRYQFQRIKGLFEPENSLKERQGIEGPNGKHPYVTRVSGTLPTLEIRINEKDTPFVYAHKVGGVAYVPGAFFADVALFYGTEVFETVPHDVRVSFRLLSPVSVSEGHQQKLTLITEVKTLDKATFKIFHQNSVCVFGEVHRTGNTSEPEQCDIAAVRRRCTYIFDKDSIYDRLKQFGFQYGGPLQLLTKCESNSEECLAWLSVSDLVKGQMMKTYLHPSILDAVMQSTCAVYSSKDSDFKERMPAVIGEVTIHRKLPEHMMCYCKMTSQSTQEYHFRIVVLSCCGEIIIEMNDFVIRNVGQTEVMAEDLEFGLLWAPVDLGKMEGLKGKLIILHGKDEPRDMLSELARFQDIDRFEMNGTPVVMKTFQAKLLQQSHSNNILEAEKINGIVFYANCQSDVVNAPTMNGFTQLYTNLKEIVCFLAKNNIDVPVSVVTIKTQTLTSDKGDVRLEGAHLWGMVRCFLREDSRRIQLLDLSDFSKATLETLAKCIDTFNAEDVQSKEILISDGTAYGLSVRSCRRVTPVRERLCCQGEVNEPLRVISTKKTSQCPRGFRLGYFSPEPNPLPEEHHVLVDIHQIVVPHESVYPQNVFDESQHALQCVEAEGCIRNGTTENEVLVLYPSDAATVLTVSKQYTLSKSIFQNYKPGLLTFLGVILSVTKQIKASFKIGIIADKASFCYGNLVKDLLGFRGCEHVELYGNDLKPNIPTKETHLILFSYCPLELILSEENEVTNHVIAFQGFGGERAIQKTRLTKPGVVYEIIKAWEVLQPNNISESLAEISEMLSTDGKRLNEICNTFEERHLYIFASEVIQLKGDRAPPLYLTERTLFRRNAAYVVVGGLSGLGWLLTKFIAEMGAGLVVVMSRRPLDKESAKKFGELSQDTGTQIDFLQADVCKLSTLESAFAALRTKYPDKQIKGIFQGAGVLKDSLLIKSTPQMFQEVSAPKIIGSLNLHCVSRKQRLQLDFFLLHSSVASILGSAGQTSYAAANSFLDTFARYRRQLGLPGQSVNWGPLSVGMAVRDQAIISSWKAAGFEGINEQGIRDCFTHALLSNDPQVSFLHIARQRFQVNPILAEDLRRALDNTDGKPFSNTVLGDVEFDVPAVQKMNPSQRQDAIWNYVKIIVNKELPVSSELLQPSTPLLSLGSNSMNAVSISNMIKTTTGLNIPSTRLLSEDLVLSDIALDIDKALKSTNTLYQTAREASGSKMTKARMSPLISPMQGFIYKNYQENYNNNDILQVTELRPDIALTEMQVEDAVATVIQRNKTLRTVYRTNGKDVIPVVLEKFDCPTVTVVEQPEFTLQQIEKNYKIPFELNKDLPLRIVYVRQTTRNPTIWFIFHPITFDLRSINLFFKEFKDVLTSENLPVVSDVDIPREVFQVLNPQFRELDIFWKSKLHINSKLPLLSLSKSPDIDSKPSAVEHSTEFLIQRDIVSQVAEMSKHLKITMFQFLVSASQLQWHLLTGEERIGLMVDIDTRQHVPALMNVITHCVNYLPVIASFEKGITLKAFLQNNAAEVKACVLNSLYPGYLVLENISEETAANVCRHNIVMEDLTDQINLTQDKVTAVGKAGPMGIHRETRLLIWASEKHRYLKLQLDYHPGIVTKQLAQEHLSGFEAVLHFIVKNQDILVEKISRSILPSSSIYPVLPDRIVETGNPKSGEEQHAPDVPKLGAEQQASDVLKSDIQARGPAVMTHRVKRAWPDDLREGAWFEKKTWLMCCLPVRQEVFLSVDFRNGVPDTLIWGADEHCRKERMPLVGIKTVNSKPVKGGASLIIRSSARTVQFRSGDEAQVDRWARALQPHIRSGEHTQAYVNRGASFDKDESVAFYKTLEI